MAEAQFEKWLERFGHDAFRPGQREVVELLLGGSSAFALFPTGGGKSLCYQLPAMILEGTSVVVSPLLALMRDQVDALKLKGLPAARLDSTQDEAEQVEVLRMLEGGHLKLLFVSPERFLAPGFRKRLRNMPLGLIAVDEAHCVSEWGQRFRPDYLKLGQAMRGLGFQAKLALTATASPQVARDIRRAFGIKARDSVRTPMSRPELALKVEHLPSAKSRMDRLVELLHDSPGLPAIVYVRVQRTADAVSAGLAKAGFSARSYHAGMNSEARELVQTGFIDDEFDVIVATIAFGMGIDKSNIRQIVHYDLPSSLEAYQQETGRAGRDRMGARATALVTGEDWMDLENRIASDRVSPAILESILRRIRPEGGSKWFSVYDAATELDVSMEFIEVLLAKLELQGAVKLIRQGSKRLKMNFLRPVESGYPKLQLKQLAVCQEHREIRDVVAFCDEPDWDVGRFLDLLQEAERAGDLQLRATHRLLNLAPGKKPFPVTSDFLPWLEDRQLSDRKRLQELGKLFCSRTCLAKRLAAYFGEKSQEPCGKCSVCEGANLPRKIKFKPRELRREDLELIRDLSAQKPVLRRSSTMARFLIGLYSPSIGRYRLAMRDEYGNLKGASFEEIEVQARSMS